MLSVELITNAHKEETGEGSSTDIPRPPARSKAGRGGGARRRRHRRARLQAVGSGFLYSEATRWAETSPSQMVGPAQEIQR